MARLNLATLADEAEADSGLESLELEARNGTVVKFRHALLLPEEDREAVEKAVLALQGATPEEASENVKRATLVEIERLIREALLAIADDRDAATELLRGLGLHPLVAVLKEYTKATKLGEASPSPES